MTQKNESEGSKSHVQSSTKHDRVDEKEVVPFKKRTRFLASDNDNIKEVSQMEINTSKNKDKQIISSTSGQSSTIKKNKTEIVSYKKSTRYDKHTISATLSLLEMRKSRESAKKVSMCYKYKGYKIPHGYEKFRKIHVGYDEYASRNKAEIRNKGKKPVEYDVSSIVHGGKTTKSSHSPEKNGGIKEDDYEYEEGEVREDEDDYEEGEVREGDDVFYEEIRQVEIMEDGDNNQDESNRGKKTLDIDVNVFYKEEVHESEIVSNEFDTAIDTKKDEYSAGGFQELQVVAMEEEGGDENNIRNNEQVENMKDGDNLEDNHESSGINESVSKNQDKKGKGPITYVSYPTIQELASNRCGKGSESNQNNAPIVHSDTERGRLELELAELLAVPVRILKELEDISNNTPHFNIEGNVLGGPSANLTQERNIDGIRERNHGENDKDIAVPHGHMLETPITTTQNESIHEIGEVSKQKPKHSTFDNVFGHSRWVLTANNPRLRLFKQHPKPTVVLRLLGYDIEVPEEELQASAQEIRDEGSNENNVELSMQQKPKYGLRLMGFDL